MKQAPLKAGGAAEPFPKDCPLRKRHTECVWLKFKDVRSVHTSSKPLWPAFLKLKTWSQDRRGFSMMPEVLFIFLPALCPKYTPACLARREWESLALVVCEWPASWFCPQPAVDDRDAGAAPLCSVWPLTLLHRVRPVPAYQAASCESCVLWYWD